MPEHVPTVRQYEMFGRTRFAATCSCGSEFEAGGLESTHETLDLFARHHALPEVIGERDQLREALQEAVRVCTGPVRHAPNPIYTPQVPVPSVDGWRALIGGRS